MKFRRPITFFLTSLICLPALSAQEIFIYRPYLPKDPVIRQKKVTLHGEYFGCLLYPGNFPSYNDLSGPEDRFNFGFQNTIHIGDHTRFLAQLVTHDDGGKRTKFDWHFSLRHSFSEHMVLILGHDSNHDSDYQSRVQQNTFYLNRNYIGVGLPFSAGSFYIEPFTWFFHHRNHRSFLDYSGEKLKQEYGIRLGWLPHSRCSLSIQVIAQSDTFFSIAQAYLADIILRIELWKYLHLSAGPRIWKDIRESPSGNKTHYFQMHWGLAITF